MLKPSSLAVETRVADQNVAEGCVRKINLFYYNRSRYGKIRKHVNEKYIRSSAYCGLKLCTKCASPVNIHQLEPIGQSSPNRVMQRPHCLIVDSKVLVKFIELFQENVLPSVLIPLSSWRTVKATKSRTFLKLREMYELFPHGYFVFGNDAFADTMPIVPLSKVDGESTLVAITANYLLAHWRERGVVPLVLTNSDADMRQIERDYPYVTTLLNYVRGMSKSEERNLLVQRVKKLGETEEKSREKTYYEIYKSSEELDLGVRNGTVKVGKFMVTVENNQEAYVTCESVRILVHGRADMNRAIDGDKVAVQLLPESKWRAPEGRFRTKDIDEEKVAADDKEAGDRPARDASAASQRAAANVMKTGKIVSILQRRLKHYCGILEPPDRKNGSHCLFRPADRRLPCVRIETRAYHAAVGKKVLCSIVRWPADSRLPQGSLIRVIGGIGERDAENEVILLEHGVRYRDFTADERSELPQGQWAPASPLEWYRQDLTYLDVCSVDPVGCTDIDDALHFREMQRGRYEVGVHIADVSHFVRAGSPLDLEASRRCTTVYLCGRRIDMLPELLSSNLCSLRADQPRYAMSVIWEINDNAEVLATRFTKSLIRSRRAFTYEQAQVVHDDANDNSVLATSLRGLMRLSKVMRERRRARGSLSLASMEVRFDFNAETGEPIGVTEKKALDTMSMIEEFMLLANVAVAEECLRRFPSAAMLRRHPVPEPEAFLPLIEAGKEMGFAMHAETNQTLAESLDRAVDAKNPEANRILRMLATRCMTQALYFPAGSVPSEQFRHYGLAIPVYTHFTSPIRRYADVVVHRQLATHLGIFKPQDMPKTFSGAHLKALTEEMNMRNRMAQRANRASVVLNTQFMLDSKPTQAQGFVTQLKENGVQIVVPRYGVDSIVEFAADAATPPPRLSLFQKVRVRLSVTERNQRRYLNMELLEPDDAAAKDATAAAAEAQATDFAGA